MLSYVTNNPFVLLYVFIPVLTGVYIWLARVEDKKNKNLIEKVGTAKLPWVKTSDELRALEKKSPAWYFVTIPLRILNVASYLDPSPVGIGQAFFPIAVLLLLILYLWHKFKG